MGLYLHRPKQGALSDPELIWGSLGLMVLLTARFMPTKLMSLYACPFRTLTGIPCFSCGMTRTFRFMARLEPGKALRLNPLGTALFVFVAVFVLYAAVVLLFRLPRVRFTIKHAWMKWALRLGIPAVVIANWIYVMAVDS